ncbi:gamma conglutin 1-like [Vigna unguiculata]|uniref:Aspartyl protease family protein n=1 Tax=Vigna unguiculata TaxID=3917 RepID=A0A4D6KTE8_VIGUN|nr:gamma conglutin 1-like [Vigna unguiculata]QCD77094.1 aspartyl protease family protein [Vigna unguiculata]
MASPIVHFSLLILSLLFVSCISEGKPRPFILPIAKDSKTNLFYTSLGLGTPRHHMDLVIDLGGPFLWYDCDKTYNSSSYHPVHCESKSCPGGAPCTGCTSGPFKPGCSNDTCGAFILNPYADAIFTGDFGEDVLFLSQSHTVLPGLISGCTSTEGSSLLNNLPQTGKGILGLARTQLALPTQLSLSRKLPRKFAICLPSSNKHGLGNLFIGGAPQDASKLTLFTTPLVVNPFSTAPIFSEGEPSYEYFIVVKSVKVDGGAINFKPSLLSIDNKGHGGTKISTINPFTAVHSAIFKPLVREFSKKAVDRKMRKVTPVAPFGACFDFSSIGRTVTGLDVPTIELELEGGVTWKVYGGNSMVLVNKKVACLGFVDGGKDAETSVVIGGHVLEDNLVEFDLVSSKLSFSSSLLLHNARCSHIRT